MIRSRSTLNNVSIRVCKPRGKKQLISWVPQWKQLDLPPAKLTVETASAQVLVQETIPIAKINLATQSNSRSANQSLETPKKMTSDENNEQTIQNNVPREMERKTIGVAVVYFSNTTSVSFPSSQKNGYFTDNPRTILGSSTKRPFSNPSFGT